MVARKKSKYQVDPAAFRAWHERMGFTYETGAEALDVHRSAYAGWLAGTTPIDLRTGLACKAIEEGIRPLKKLKIDEVKL